MECDTIMSTSFYDNIKTVIISKSFYNKQQAYNIVENLLNLSSKKMNETYCEYLFHQYDAFMHHSYDIINDNNLIGVVYVVPRKY